VSFPSEPGRDDGNLPPVNVVIPDDARELDRDVLAYRREVRARRRRERLLRIIRPLGGTGFGTGAAIIPLIAACLVLSLVGGALLSIMTVSPPLNPTVAAPRTPASPTHADTNPDEVPVALPAGSVLIGSRPVLEPVRSLASSVIAIIPDKCDCGPELQHLTDLTDKASVPLYFAGTGAVINQLAQLSASYSGAIVAADPDGVLETAFKPAGLVVLLVYDNARAIPFRTQLPPDSTLTAELGELRTASI
jgi:hypothetical protein